jgi:glycosyltransferase involved in cell wall biosynthesis
MGKPKSDTLRIGYIGQIISIKGVHILIEAYRKMCQGRNVRLEIWGGLEKDPEYTGRLKAMISGEPSITLQGRFAHDDLAEVFSKIDVLVVPSLWYENAPLVIQEAFATRTPVIATNVGGMAEMVSAESNGLLFERGNPDDLARQLQRLVDDSSLLDRLMAGIPRVKTVQEEVTELEQIYLELVRLKNNTQGDGSIL